MSEMIERVARALCSLDWGSLPEGGGPVFEIYFRQARAAIEAMREPTEGMVLAAIRADADDMPFAQWRAMIDEVLK
jgi:hypothetical protein